MASFNLRLKSIAGQKTISSLTSSSSIQALCSAVAEAASIRCDEVRLLSGFPPKTISLEDLTATLDSAGIHTGDTLILQSAGKTRAPTSSSDEAAAVGSTPAKQPRLDDANLVEHLSSNNTGFLVRRVVDADNSCLFSAFNLTMGRAHASPMSLRKEIALVVHENKQVYTEAFLGRDNAEYCAWILVDSSWGGAIEVSLQFC